MGGTALNIETITQARNFYLTLFTELIKKTPPDCTEATYGLFEALHLVGTNLMIGAAFPKDKLPKERDQLAQLTAEIHAAGKAAMHTKIAEIKNRTSLIV